MTAYSLPRLSQLRDASLAMLDGLSSADRRRQPHAALSPMLWHVGHVFFVENYWLAERVFGDTSITDRWRTLYFPEACPKGERSTGLPSAQSLIDWSHEVAAHSDAYWQRVPDTDHPLLTDGYLHAFLCQHYAQHLETMRMAAAQLALAHPVPAQTLSPASPSDDRLLIDADQTALGCETIAAYDNEQPVFNRPMTAFYLGKAPVSNAEWMGFITERGYARPEFWDSEGWAWRESQGITHPQHWQPAANGQWHIPGLTGGVAEPTAPVHGLSWYEARAFARYAGARLPHEAEWETARRCIDMPGHAQVWEWCDNAFEPYPGFRPFPYDGYSLTWFDGQHRVARGASVHSEADIQRPSFRNFYPPTHRHVFAGLRLAW